MKLLLALGYVPKRDVEAAKDETERLFESRNPTKAALQRAEIFQQIADAFADRRRREEANVSHTD
jgi:Tfp pilus assembly protein PilF